MNNNSIKKNIIDFNYTASFIKLNWRRLVLFVIIYNVLMTLSHIFLPAPLNIADINNHSELALKFGFPLVAAAYTFLVSIILVLSICLVIPFIRDFKKSMFKLTLFLGLLWFIGFFEAIFSEETYLDLLILAIGDSIPAFLLVFLIAKYSINIHDDFKTEGKLHENDIKYRIISVFAITISFTIVRLIGYYIINMKSRIDDMAVGIFIWTVLMGLLIGLEYIMYQKMDCNGLWIHRVFRFVIILFGINWIIFNLFVPLLLNEPYMEFIGYRGILDIVSVFVGAMGGKIICTFVCRTIKINQLKTL
jgi:hypothetical protein